jgi:hypothetical protein
MTLSRKRRLFFVILATIIAIIVVIDSTDLFVDSPYQVVPHGNHNHYVPHDRDPNIPIHEFPMTPPRPGERITPDGRIVRD